MIMANQFGVYIYMDDIYKRNVEKIMRVFDFFLGTKPLTIELDDRSLFNVRTTSTILELELWNGLRALARMKSNKTKSYGKVLAQ